MNRIDQLFQTHKDHVLSIYFCAGTPTLEGTAEVIRTLERKGVQMIEIGIPFSDPMADGPVIQHAATQALRNGMTLRKLFGQLEQIRTDVRIPLVLMGYLNPIMQYGFENFCRQCQACGIDGVIIPDLPYKDYFRSLLPKLCGLRDRRGHHPRPPLPGLYGNIQTHSRPPRAENHHAHHAGNQRRTHPANRCAYRRIHLYGIFCGRDGSTKGIQCTKAGLLPAYQANAVAKSTDDRVRNLQ